MNNVCINSKLSPWNKLKIEGFWFVFKSFCSKSFNNFPKKNGDGRGKQKRADIRTTLESMDPEEFCLEQEDEREDPWVSSSMVCRCLSTTGQLVCNGDTMGDTMGATGGGSVTGEVTGSGGCGRG